MLWLVKSWKILFFKVSVMNVIVLVFTENHMNENLCGPSEKKL